MPAITDNESFNDNVNFVAKQREADLVSTLTPSIYLNGDTTRLQTTLSYSPQFIKYAAESNQDQIAQNLVGSGTLKAITDLLFVNASATSAVVDRSGGLGFGNQVQIPASQSTQTTVYTLSPYMTFHFGDTGDSQVRYQLSQAIFSGNTGAFTSTTTGTTLSSISNTTSQTGTANFTTGQAFGRLQLGATANYSQQSGGGAASSQQETGGVNAAYQISAPYSVLANLGYQRYTFSQSSAGNFTGLSYSVGARYQPRADRAVTVNYGESQGTTSVSGSANYPLTQLAMLTASYGVVTTTEQQQLVQNLANLTQTAPGSTTTATGMPIPIISPGQQLAGPIINPITGLPTSLQNPNLTLQNSVVRAKTLQVGLVFEGGQRNHYSVSFNRSESNGLGTGAASLLQTSSGGVVTYGRDMNPLMQGTLSAGYSTTSSNGGGLSGSTTISSVTFNAGLTYALGRTVSSALTYSFIRQYGGITGTIQDDIVALSLQKTF